MRKLLTAAAVAAAAFTAVPAAAAVTVLTFEGIADQAPVGAFYAPNYIFSAATLALIDADAGGTGNFANEPSADTIMFFLDANDAILNVTSGFTTGFSFFYTSSTAASVTVYDGLNATGNVLGSLALTANAFGCPGDPGGAFSCWSPVGVAFSGTAFSIDFGGTANQSGFDNITFGSARPGVIPEPATWAMLIAGFGLVGFAMRRRQRAVLA
jgi:hypothetical protein